MVLCSLRRKICQSSANALDRRSSRHNKSCLHASPEFLAHHLTEGKGVTHLPDTVSTVADWNRQLDGNVALATGGGDGIGGP